MGKETCNLECPKCHKLWAKMKYEYDSRVSASDVKILVGKKRKFHNGESLACVLCGHTYTNHDVMLAIAIKEAARG